MVGNRGEIILNPNIAATMEKYRENNVRFSIILPIFFSSEGIKFLYIKLSVKLALHLYSYLHLYSKSCTFIWVA
jgi:hypothetical protein